MIVYGKERDYIVWDDDNIKGLFHEYKFLSNFEECPVYFDGLMFGSTEAAYQSAKITDPVIKLQFAESKPRNAMIMGRSFENSTVFRKDWYEIRYDVMASVVFDKFYRNIELRSKLLETGSKYIEESNHWADHFYGVCDGTGENNMGKILMKVRDFWNNKTKL